MTTLKDESQLAFELYAQNNKLSYTWDYDENNYTGLVAKFAWEAWNVSRIAFAEELVKKIESHQEYGCEDGGFGLEIAIDIIRKEGGLE